MTLYYNSRTLSFPRYNFSIDVNVSRELIPDFCRQLHAIMQECAGASLYYPHTDTDETICRYEWHQEWNKVDYGLHLGMHFKVSNEPLKKINAYFTTNEAIKDNSSELPDFKEDKIKEIQHSFFSKIGEAMQRTDPQASSEYHYIFYLKLNPTKALDENLQIGDKITLFSSSLIEGKTVSAVSISVKGTSLEEGKPKALTEFSKLCALLTLGTGTITESTSLTWGEDQSPPRQLESVKEVDLESLYPKVNPQPYGVQESTPDQITSIWDLYRGLPENEIATFESALFTYYSAETIKFKYSTQSIVAYIATLSKLASDYKEKCPGEVTCSECGSLTMKHNITGDKAAILLLLNDLLSLDIEKEKILKKIINRVYYKQRSAFVHDAILRHEEFYQGYGLPSTFPSSDSTISDTFYYKQDFLSIKKITRRCLIEWLSKKTNIQIDHQLFWENADRLHSTIPFEAAIGAPPGVVVKPFHEGNKESDSQ